MKLGSGKEPHPLKGPIYRPKQKAKRLLCPRAKYNENGKGRVAGSDVAHRINPSVLNLPLTQPP
jgi:hypothetical protein